MKIRAIYSVIILLTVLTAQSAMSQITIINSTLSTKQFFIDDLLNIQIISGQVGSVAGYLEINIESQNHLPILKITSPNFSLNSGVNELPSLMKIASRWLYSNNTLASTLQQTGQLPDGPYIFCLTFYSGTDQKMLGLNCQEKKIGNMQPPHLASPLDGEEIYTTYPVLSWIPPTPVSDLNVQYTLRLVEVRNRQTTGEALRNNQPLVDLKKLNGLFLNYPSTAQELIVGKQYAWEIAAFSDNYFLGKSETWKFIVGENNESTARVAEHYDPTCYKIITEHPDGGYYEANGILKFTFSNTVNDTLLGYSIYNTSNMSQVSNLSQVALTYGLNKISLDLTSNSLEDGGEYLLSIIDSDNKHYDLIFTYTMP